ncbi:sugar ABC transporter ATP-binding protein [Cellulomonas hominis]|uniref:sugar ABC transporter ATP-binding protein n=1 Tax=Cellulomonas hominis TaxID=156981 RepID=UPI001C1098F6|nr:sugar ABC transporter ATP-binding protein [Cellulomonas hominis]MBU5422739.1 sugar ABC transporter ATP-binding protein [Cellulomonas hominis]
MTPEPIVEMRDVTVAFPGTTALDAVSLRLFGGEVHALLGENGAGKSTLLKVLTGVQQPDAGTVLLDGAPVRMARPADALRLGVRAVYQELDLLPNLSVAENVMLGHEDRRFGLISRRAMRDRAAGALAALGVRVDPGSRLGSHPMAVQQLVAIARATVVRPRVVVLDEPTSSLDPDEVTELFRTVRRMRDSGIAVVFVSHFLEQVYEIADRLTVLRDGRRVGEYLTGEILRVDLVRRMVGKDLPALDSIPAPQPPADEPAAAADPPDDVVLRAEGLGRRGAVAPFDLDVAEGEVVAVAGLLGSGRTELVRLLSGVDRADSGTLRLFGEPVSFRDPADAIAHRVVYSAENRRRDGIVAELSVADNILLALQAEQGWWRPVHGERRDELVASYIELLDIRPPDPDALAGTLSGGNQQKVLLARWLATAPRVLVLDEPTRGIDIGAKVEVQRLVAELAAGGMSVLFVSAELEEGLRLAHRVVVLREGAVVADVPNDGLTLDSVLALIAYAAAPGVAAGTDRES